MHGHFGSDLRKRLKMNKKQYIIEICVYVLIIMLLIFGVGKVKKEKYYENPPAVEVPHTTERVQ